jgi:uncharacterized membrane protein YbhN (UPF0104 family)
MKSRILRLCIGIAALAWLIVWVDWRQLAAAVRRCDPWWAAAGMALFFVAAVPAALRMKALFRVPAGEAIRLTFASYFFNQLLPTGLGGDVYRTVRLRNENSGWTSTIGLLALERAIGALTLVLPALGYAIVQHGGSRVIGELRGRVQGTPTALFAVLAGVALAALVPILFARVRHHVRRIAVELLTTLRHLSFAAVCAAVLASLCFHGLRLLAMRSFSVAVGYPVAPGDMLIVLALTMFASLVPVSVGALGVREGMLVYLLGMYGVPPAEGLTVALLARLMVILPGIVGGLVFYTDRARTSDARSPGGPSS